jgi:3-phosphoshikimate 1-carboxyvinyltransferase
VNGRVCPDKVEIEGKGGLLKAADVDARDIPDLVPVCTVLGCYAKGTSKIHDAHRLRYKESDRLTSLHLELKKMGAKIVMDGSSLTVKGPCALHGATIQDSECVRKSYPKFFTDLRVLGADVVGGEFDR